VSRHRILALVAGLALALALGGAASAYNGTAAETVTVTGPGPTVVCAQAMTFSATVLDDEDQPVSGASVDWSVTANPAHAEPDVINANPTVTNASGVATTTITFSCNPGRRTVTATVGEEASGELSLTVLPAAGGGVGGAVGGPGPIGLPNTSTAASDNSSGLPAIGPALAFVALLVGAGLIVRRFALLPR
jgi:Big-like domain-containing protein